MLHLVIWKCVKSQVPYQLVVCVNSYGATIYVSIVQTAYMLTILLLQWNLPFPFLSTIGTNFSKSQSHGFRLVCPELYGQKDKGKVKVIMNLYIHYVFCILSFLFAVVHAAYLIFLANLVQKLHRGHGVSRDIMFIVVWGPVRRLSPPPLMWRRLLRRLTPSLVIFQWLK